MRTARIAAACLGASTMLAGATAAQAAEFSFQELNNGEWYRDGYRIEMRYTADPGERNRVTASYDGETDTFTLTDPGALLIRPALGDVPLDALTGCSFERQRVTCVGVPDHMQYYEYFRYELGDKDDRVTFTSDDPYDVHPTFLGGAGNDTLTQVGAANAQFDGGAGSDTLIGGDGPDVIQARDGAADRYTCGGGADEVLADPLDAFGPSPLGDASECESVEVQ